MLACAQKFVGKCFFKAYTFCLYVLVGVVGNGGAVHVGCGALWAVWLGDEAVCLLEIWLGLEKVLRGAFCVLFFSQLFSLIILARRLMPSSICCSDGYEKFILMVFWPLPLQWNAEPFT